MTKFIVSMATAISAITACEKEADKALGIAKARRKDAGAAKVAAYVQIIVYAANAPVWNRKVSGNFRKALEQAGIKHATAKRYVENSNGLLRRMKGLSDVAKNGKGNRDQFGAVADLISEHGLETESAIRKFWAGEPDKVESLIARYVALSQPERDEFMAKAKVTAAEHDAAEAKAKDAKAGKPKAAPKATKASKASTAPVQAVA